MDCNIDLISAHENGIAGFLVPARAARFRATIGNPHGRAKVRASLAHSAADFDKRWATKLASSITVRDIEKLLRTHGAPGGCYLLSQDPEVDGACMELTRALDSSVTADHPAIISCVPSRLALFVDEAPGGQWLLHRGAQAEAQ
jgi:hypothetical protein